MKLNIKSKIFAGFLALLLVANVLAYNISPAYSTYLNQFILMDSSGDLAEVSDEGKLNVIDVGSVPVEYSKQSATSRSFLIQKGQLNKLRIRPQVLNEHAESSREIQAEVDASTIVGQVFKASHDNINGINLAMESAAAVVLDNFESYADSAAIQLVWVKGGTDEAELETTIVKSGTKSMKLSGDVLNDDWVDTISSTDYTDYTFNFDWQQDKEYNKLKYEFILSDGTDTLSHEIVATDKDIWNHFDVSINSMTDSGTTDKTAITKIGFRVTDREGGKYAYVDDVETTPPPGSVAIKLWDMGSSIPVSTTTSLDDGTQYEKLGDLGISGTQIAEVEVQLEGGFRVYQIDDVIAGVALEIPTNELLTVDNYYALTINYVDTDVDIYGPNTSFSVNYYENGYAFTAPNESTAITAIGTYSDLMFTIYSTQDVYIVNMGQVADATPNGDSRSNVYIEDMEMKRSDTIIVGTPGRIGIDAEMLSRPAFMEKGAKLEEEYNDDFSDSVSKIDIGIRYFYIPAIAHN